MRSSTRGRCVRLLAGGLALMAVIAVIGLGQPARAEGVAFGAGPPALAPSEEGDGDSGGPDGPPMADKQIIDYQMWRLSQDLQLSDVDAARVFPRLRRLGEAQSQLRRDRLKLMKKLKASLNGSRSEELEGLVQQVRDSEVARMQNIAGLEDSVLSALSSRQQAQYLVSRDEFFRDLRRMAEEARGPRSGGGNRPRGMGGPRPGLGRPGGPGGPGGLPPAGAPDWSGGPRGHR